MSAALAPLPPDLKLARGVPALAALLLAMLLSMWWLAAQGGEQHPWDDAMRHHDKGGPPPEPPQEAPPPSSGCGCDCSGVDCSGVDCASVCEGVDCASCVAEGLCDALGACTVSGRTGGRCAAASPWSAARSWGVLALPLVVLVLWRRRARRDEASAIA
jgi:hypothetical protein